VRSRLNASRWPDADGRHGQARFALSFSQESPQSTPWTVANCWSGMPSALLRSIVLKNAHVVTWAGARGLILVQPRCFREDLALLSSLGLLQVLRMATLVPPPLKPTEGLNGAPEFVAFEANRRSLHSPFDFAQGPVEMTNCRSGGGKEEPQILHCALRPGWRG
jgi:hypothetical protein